jgi:hypothetical protein
MAKDELEGTTLTLTCVVNGKPKSNQATIEVCADDKPFETQQVELESNRAELDVECPDVPVDADNYTLTYKAEVDGVTCRNKHIYTIWPRKLEVEAVKLSDESIVGDAWFVVAQADKTKRTQTDSKTGKAECWLDEAKPFDEPTVEPPWRIDTIEAAVGHKRKFKAKLFRGIKAEFVSPAAGGDHKHYVNVDGIRLELEVGAAGDQVNAIKQGRSGDKIYFKVSFGRESGRSSPQPKVKRARTYSLQSSNGDKLWTGHVKLDKVGGTKKFSIELGHAGGDTCKVEIGGTEACSDATLNVVNWRRLSYRLSYPDVLAAELADGTDLANQAAKDLPDALRTIADAQLEANFVEWKLRESVEWDLAGVAAAHPEVKVPNAYIKDKTNSPSRDRVILNSTSREYLSGAEKNKPADKRCVQLNLCDRILSPKPHASVAKQKKATKRKVTITVRKSDGHVPYLNAFKKARWKAVIANPAQYMENIVADYTRVTDPNSDGKVEVEATADGGSCTLDFKRSGPHHDWTATTPAHELQLRQLLDPIIADVARLRADHHIPIKLTMNTGNTRRTTREAAVKTYIDQYLASQPKVARHPGLADDGTPLEGRLDRAVDCTVVDMSTCQVKLPEPAASLVASAESATQCKIKVSVELRVCDGGNGSAKAGRALFKFRPADVKGFAKTILHELGHMIGLAPVGYRSAAPGVVAKHVDNGGTYYSNKASSTPNDGNSGYRNRHKGHHCAAGCPDLSAANFSSQTGTCIMFGGPIQVDPEFCDDCNEHIKSRNLKDLHTPWDTMHRSDPADF